jgi:hypothetical protein
VIKILDILENDGRPLTARQVAQCAEVCLADAIAALEELRASGSVRRLNTVVQTFTARFL